VRKVFNRRLQDVRFPPTEKGWRILRDDSQLRTRQGVIARVQGGLARSRKMTQNDLVTADLQRVTDEELTRNMRRVLRAKTAFEE
jgi:hypothetical protein